MTRALRRLAILATLLCGAAAPAGNAPRADVPLARVVEASRCAAWSRLGTIRFTGVLRAEGLAGPVTRTLDARSGRYAQRWSDGVFPSAAGFDGRRAWTVDRSGVAHALNAGFARSLARSEAWIAMRGWCAPHHGGARVERVSHAHAGGVPYDIVTVRIVHAAPLELWIDPRGRLVRVVRQETESRVATRYGDWRDVAGVAVPFREVETDLATGDVSTTLWSHIAAGAHAPGASFAPPPAPDDFTHLSRPTAIPAHFEGEKIFVDATIGGAGPFPLILDTGGHLFLSPDIAARLHLRVRGRAVGTGAGAGLVVSGLARVPALRLGGVVLRDQIAKIRRLHYPAAFRGPRPPVAGVIGLELFERYAVTIDAHARTVVLADAAHVRTDVHGFPAPRRPAVLPLAFVEDAPLLEGAVEGRHGAIEVDTGNGGPPIVEPVFAHRTGIAATFAHGVGYGGSGAGGAFTSSLARVRLRIGPFVLANEAAQLVRDAVGAEATVSTAANVGPSVLSRFVATFDYHRGTLTLVPVPGATAPPLVATGLALARTPTGALRVTGVAAGSAAARAGLRAGTTIVRVAGIPAARLGTVDVGTLAAAHLGRTLAVDGTYGGARRAYALRIEELVPRRTDPGVTPKANLNARAR
jgi:hypothetical protein